MYVSQNLLELDTLPKKLVIIGGGYIGMEFASMYANFGSEVTVIQDSPVFLPREDDEIACTVLEHLTGLGIRILLSSQTTAVEQHGERALVRINTPDGPKEEMADAVLVATGRRPNVDGLGLEKASVELTARGTIKTDEHLRTTTPDIWAMGDVTGGLQLTYISLDDFRIIKSQLFENGDRTVFNRGAVPTVYF